MFSWVYFQVIDKTAAARLTASTGAGGKKSELEL